MSKVRDYIDAEWCYKEECTAPIVNGVPLCEHDQYENPYPEG